ncbi:MAG: TIGR03013 family XrtA/PEP-CTERM system glycosyltransferase [Casimicrobiaceae bacterium]
MVRLFSHWFPSSMMLQIILDAVLLFFSAILVMVWLNTGQVPSLDLLAPSALLFAVAMTIINAALGLYQRNGSRSIRETTARSAVSLLLSVPVAYWVFRLLPWDEVPHEALKLAALLSLTGLVAVRGFATHGGSKPMMVRRMIVLGTGFEAAAVEHSLQRFGVDVKIVGFYPVESADATHVPADRILVGALSLAETVRRHGVEEVVVAVRERRGGVLPLRDLLDCKLAGVRVLDLSSYYERALGQVRLDSLHASWLIFGEGFRQSLARMFVKRVVDIVAATALLAISAPVMLVTAALVAAENGFPVLYRQERIGQGGRIFRVIKFRSMRTDAEVDGTPRWATSNDVRVTRVGRVIRKYRIDELPQLINVLKGDMSLIGPRPERPFFVDQLAREIPFYGARHSVKPGITGWAQVRYRYGASVDDAVQKLQYDLYYVKNHTLFLDILVLFETIGVVLTAQGAH